MKPDKNMTVEQFIEKLIALNEQLSGELKTMYEDLEEVRATQRQISMLTEQYGTLVQVRKDLGLEAK